MRWPLRTRPGMVRLSRREYIRLLEGAAEARRLEEQIRSAEAQTRALAILEREPRVSTAAAESTASEAVLVDLPLNAFGELHEAAFTAWRRDLVWAGRDEVLRGGGA